jgi:hypothetical protein
MNTATQRVNTGIYKTTDGHAKIERVWTGDGARPGWNLIVQGVWFNTFATKRDAVDAYDLHVANRHA